MNNENPARDIKSIEEFTIYALERTGEGLELVQSAAMRCAEAIEVSDLSALQQLGELARNVSEFDVFENSICELFMLDRSMISDGRGTLKDAKNAYVGAMQTLGALLQVQDLPGVARLLKGELVAATGRLRELMPALGEYIRNEYMAA